MRAPEANSVFEGRIDANQLEQHFPRRLSEKLLEPGPWSRRDEEVVWCIDGPLATDDQHSADGQQSSDGQSPQVGAQIPVGFVGGRNTTIHGIFNDAARPGADSYQGFGGIILLAKLRILRAE